MQTRAGFLGNPIPTARGKRHNYVCSLFSTSWESSSAFSIGSSSLAWGGGFPAPQLESPAINQNTVAAMAHLPPVSSPQPVSQTSDFLTRNTRPWNKVLQMQKNPMILKAIGGNRTHPANK